MRGPPLLFEFDFTYAIEGLPKLLAGLVITVGLAIVVMVICLPLGLAVAGMRMSRFRIIRAPAYLYTEVFRTTPILIWVYLLFFALPVQYKIDLPVFWIGVLALSLNIAAFLGEVFRAAITSIDPGQREAALSTGMSNFTAFRRIVLPQAARRSIPLVAATWISLFKDTALVALIGVTEMFYEARKIAVDTYRHIEVYTVVAILYLLLTFPQSLVVNRLFERLRVRE